MRETGNAAIAAEFQSRPLQLEPEGSAVPAQQREICACAAAGIEQPALASAGGGLLEKGDDETFEPAEPEVSLFRVECPLDQRIHAAILIAAPPIQASHD